MPHRLGLPLLVPRCGGLIASERTCGRGARSTTWATAIPRLYSVTWLMGHRIGQRTKASDVNGTSVGRLCWQTRTGLPEICDAGDSLLEALQEVWVNPR